MAKAKPAAKSGKKITSRLGAGKPAARKAAAPKAAAPKGRAKHHSWKSVEMEQLNPSLQRQLVVGTGVMLARIKLKKGYIVPLHHHHNEQVSCILEGALKFMVEGKEMVVRGGEVLTIPPHLPHSAEAMEDSLVLDVFDPPRMDWINKDDQYLRGK